MITTAPPAELKAIVIWTDPKGNVLYDAYGPMTADRDKATRFINAGVARGAAAGRSGHSGREYWDSEIEHAANARKQYRDWTFEVEEIPQLTDVQAAGHFIDNL